MYPLWIGQHVRTPLMISTTDLWFPFGFILSLHFWLTDIQTFCWKCQYTLTLKWKVYLFGRPKKKYKISNSFEKPLLLRKILDLPLSWILISALNFGNNFCSYLFFFAVLRFLWKWWDPPPPPPTTFHIYIYTRPNYHTSTRSSTIYLLRVKIVSRWIQNNQFCSVENSNFKYPLRSPQLNKGDSVNLVLEFLPFRKFWVSSLLNEISNFVF